MKRVLFLSLLAPWLWLNSAVAQNHSEQVREKIEQLISKHGHLLTENSKDVVTLYSLAWAYKEKKWFAQSIAALEQIIRVAPLDGPAYHALGMVLRMSHDSHRAIQVLEKAVEIQSNDLDVLFDLGVLYLEENQYKKAIVHFRRAIDLAPDFVAANYNYGLALLLEGRMEEAIASFLHVCRLDKKFAQGWQNLGVAASVIGRYEQALDAFSQVRQLSMANAFNTAVLHHRLNQVKEAEDAYRQVLASVRDFTPALYNLGVLTWAQTNSVQAVKLFRDLLQLDTNFFYAGLHLSEIYLGQNQWQVSTDLLSELKVPPQDSLYPHAWLSQIYWYQGKMEKYRYHIDKIKQSHIESLEKLQKKADQAYQRKEWATALQLWSELHRLQPERLDILLMYGNAALHADELQLALECFVEVVRHERSVEAQIGLAQAYQRLGRSKQALKEMERTAVIAPEVPQVWATLGQMQFENGYHEEASLSFRRALRLDRRFPAAFIGLARLAGQHNEFAEAIDLLKEAAAMQSNDPGLYDELGLLLFRQGQLGEAINAYEKGLHLAAPTQSPILLYHLAIAKLGLGQKNQAYSLIKQAAELAPEHEDIQYLFAYVCNQVGKWVDALLGFERLANENPQHEEAIRGRSKLWKLHGASIQPELLQIP